MEIKVHLKAIGKCHGKEFVYWKTYVSKAEKPVVKKLSSKKFYKVKVKKIRVVKRKKKMVENTGRVNEQIPRLKIRKNAKKPSVRSRKEYRLWRESILHKFNHTCSFCGAKERLELDHIEPVSKRPDLVMADYNARILCKPCHITTDSYPKSLRTHFLRLS